MTDILEKCARAVMEFYHGSTGSSDAFVAHSAEEIARAVIAALADGVTEEMLVTFGMTYAQDKLTREFVQEQLIARPDEMRDLRAALAAAIRAAIPEGTTLTEDDDADLPTAEDVRGILKPEGK